MARQFGIGSYHPAVAAAYFALMILFALIVNAPWFQAAGLLGAASVVLLLDGRCGVRFVGAVVVLAVVVMLVNPLFNTRGDTVLFTWWGGRPYTLEALVAGGVTAAMLAQTLLWFACLSMTLTSDKIMFLFGRWAPSLTLVLTLSLRLVGTLRRNVRRVSDARRAVGLGRAGSMTARVGEAGLVLGSVTAAAFEDGVTTADSMKNRGFGLSGKTRYREVRFGARDGVIVALMGCLAVIIVVALVAGLLTWEFFPSIKGSPWGFLQGCALGAYAVLAFLPLALHGWEVIRWRSIASSI